MLAVYKSKAGHYMALLKDERLVERLVEKSLRRRFFEYHRYIRHWLCDFEVEALLKSGWIERNGLSDFSAIMRSRKRKLTKHDGGQSHEGEVQAL